MKYKQVKHKYVQLNVNGYNIWHVKKRIALAKIFFCKNNYLFRRDIAQKTKLRLIKTFVQLVGGCAPLAPS